MTSGVFMIRMGPQRQEQLDALAKQMDRSRDSIVNEAVEQYLSLHARQVEQIRRGLSRAKREEFVSDQEIEQIFDR